MKKSSVLVNIGILTFKEIKSLYKGKVLIKTINSRFFKSLNSMNVKILDIKVSIQRSKNKKLINNKYLPIKLITPTQI